MRYNTSLRIPTKLENGFATLLLIGGLYIVAGGALAAEDVDSFALSPEQLLNATVTSVSRTSEKLIDAPAAVFVLTNEDIMRSGATSIPEALRLVPGVDVARVNANTWAIGIRGFNGTLDNKLLVLIDGRTVYDPLFSGVYWDIQDTVLEDIDRIEVIRGPGASLWGANAVNGVINIITKKAQDTQGNLVSTTVGTQDGIAEERYGSRLGDNGYYRAYVKYLDRGDEQTLAGNNAHDAQEESRGGFRADWKSAGNEKDDFTLQGDLYNSGESQYRVTSAFTSPFTREALEDLTARGGNMLGRWTRVLSDDSRLTLQSYADYTYRDQLLLADQRNTFDVDAQYELPPMERHQIIVGGGYRYSDDNLTATPLVTFTGTGEKTNVFSSFIQDKITLDPKTWFLTLGSKLEHNDYTGFEVEPNARLQWHPDETQMVWASVSRAVRTPSRLERDLTIIQLTGGSGFQFTTAGDPGFGSETVVAYEAGYRKQLIPKASLDVATFYNDYQKLSTLDLTGLNFSSPPLFLHYQYGNQTSGESYGIEATANWRVLESLSLSASQSVFALALHNIVPNAAGAQDAESQSPKYQANMHAAWDISKDVSYDAILYHVSNLQGYQVKDYARLDMRLGWKIDGGLQFDLVGQDLLGGTHREFTSPGTTSPGVVATDINRTAYGKFTWRF